MRSLPLAGGIGAAILCLALTITAVAQSGPALGPDLIVLGNADAVRVEAPQSSAPLGSLLNSVLPRLAIEYANTIREIVLGAPAAALNSALNAVGPRLTLEYANDTRAIQLAGAPAALATQLNSVAPRLQMEYANHNRTIGTEYPKALLNDRQAPVVSQFRTDGPRIRWLTNEFAISVVRVGLKSGTYTQTYTDSFFRTEHELALPQEVVDAVAAAEAAGVPDAADATYYVRILSTDLSGNQSTSSEFTARGTLKVFLPAVKK